MTNRKENNCIFLMIYYDMIFSITLQHQQQEAWASPPSTAAMSASVSFSGQPSDGSNRPNNLFDGSNGEERELYLQDLSDGKYLKIKHGTVNWPKLNFPPLNICTIRICAFTHFFCKIF